MEGDVEKGEITDFDAENRQLNLFGKRFEDCLADIWDPGRLETYLPGMRSKIYSICRQKNQLHHLLMELNCSLSLPLLDDILLGLNRTNDRGKMMSVGEELGLAKRLIFPNQVAFCFSITLTLGKGANVAKRGERKRDSANIDIRETLEMLLREDVNRRRSNLSNNKSQEETNYPFFKGLGIDEGPTQVKSSSRIQYQLTVLIAFTKETICHKLRSDMSSYLSGCLKYLETWTSLLDTPVLKCIIVETNQSGSSINSPAIHHKSKKGGKSGQSGRGSLDKTTGSKSHDKGGDKVSGPEIRECDRKLLQMGYFWKKHCFWIHPSVESKNLKHCYHTSMKTSNLNDGFFPHPLECGKHPNGSCRQVFVRLFVAEDKNGKPVLHVVFRSVVYFIRLKTGRNSKFLGYNHFQGSLPSEAAIHSGESAVLNQNLFLLTREKGREGIRNFPKSTLWLLSAPKNQKEGRKEQADHNSWKWTHLKDFWNIYHRIKDPCYFSAFQSIWHSDKSDQVLFCFSKNPTSKGAIVLNAIPITKGNAGILEVEGGVIECSYEILPVLSQHSSIPSPLVATFLFLPTCNYPKCHPRLGTVSFSTKTRYRFSFVNYSWEHLSDSLSDPWSGRINLAAEKIEDSPGCRTVLIHSCDFQDTKKLTRCSDYGLQFFQPVDQKRTKKSSDSMSSGSRLESSSQGPTEQKNDKPTSPPSNKTDVQDEGGDQERGESTDGLVEHQQSGTQQVVSSLEFLQGMTLKDLIDALNSKLMTQQEYEKCKQAMCDKMFDYHKE